MSVRYKTPRYAEYLQPRGFLVDEPACHALFHYACTAASVASEQLKVRYEGEVYVPPNYRNIFKGVAQLFGVSPESMEEHWSKIDLQFSRLGFDGLPSEARFGSKPLSIVAPPAAWRT